MNYCTFLTIFTCSMLFLNLSLQRYDREMSRCINTDTYKGYRMCFKMLYMIKLTVYGLFYKYTWQDLAWITFASIAVAKSRQNMWILMWEDFLTSVSTQFMRSCSKKTGMRLSLTLHFCRMARQNRWVTFPLSCSLSILRTLMSTTGLSP